MQRGCIGAFQNPPTFGEYLIVLNFRYDVVLIRKRLGCKFELDSMFSFRDMHTQYILIARTQSGPNPHLNVQGIMLGEHVMEGTWFWKAPIGPLLSHLQPIGCGGIGGRSLSC